VIINYDNSVPEGLVKYDKRLKNLDKFVFSGKCFVQSSFGLDNYTDSPQYAVELFPRGQIFNQNRRTNLYEIQMHEKDLIKIANLKYPNITLTPRMEKTLRDMVNAKKAKIECIGKDE
jgi:hypothetical protein